MCIPERRHSQLLWLPGGSLCDFECQYHIAAKAEVLGALARIEIEDGSAKSGIATE